MVLVISTGKRGSSIVSRANNKKQIEGFHSGKN